MTSLKPKKAKAAMKEKFPDLLAELSKCLSEVLLSDHYRIKDKESFNKDRKLDFIIFDICIFELWGKPAYEGMLAEFLKAEKAEQYAFDDRLRDHVYEVVQKARRKPIRTQHKLRNIS
jgi:hypothetical protein